MKAKERIIIALDVDSPEKAIALVQELFPYVGCFKIGLQFMTAILRSIIASSKESKALDNFEAHRKLFKLLHRNILWDGKFDDIPNTVGGASLEARKMGVKMFNLHASAGRQAIKKAVANKGNSLVLGVTVLTAIGKEECVSIFGATPEVKVLKFAQVLAEEKADGIICSPQELRALRKQENDANLGKELRKNLKGLLKVTPGIRPLWAQKGDQKRIMTPKKAIQAGADYLVIGRPITSPPEKIGGPAEAAKRIADEIAEAFSERR